MRGPQKRHLEHCTMQTGGDRPLSNIHFSADQLIFFRRICHIFTFFNFTIFTKNRSFFIIFLHKTGGRQDDSPLLNFIFTFPGLIPL